MVASQLFLDGVLARVPLKGHVWCGPSRNPMESGEGSRWRGEILLRCLHITAKLPRPTPNSPGGCPGWAKGQRTWTTWNYFHQRYLLRNLLLLLLLSRFSRVRLFVTPWTVRGPVHAISQARILEWVAMPFSRASSQPRDQSCISCVSCIACGFFTAEPPGRSHYKLTDC